MPKRTLLIILLIIILIGGIAAGSLYVRKKFAPPQEESFTPSSIEREEIAPETSPTEPSEIDTSDWKIYKNEEYRYEIKYAKEWPGINGPDKKDGILLSIGQITSKTDETLARNTELAKDPEMWLSQMRKDCEAGGGCAPAPPIFKSRLSVDGHKAIKATYATIGTDEIHVFVGTDKGIIYSISFSFGTYTLSKEEFEKYEKTEKENYEKILDAMVSTFKFLE